MKETGEKWAMLTAYDMYAAEIFDEAGIPCLLVGDSAGNNVYGFETTVPVTVDHLVPLCRAVTSAAKHAMVVADLPFGSYQASPQQALATATRFMKEGLAHAVKLEGGKPMVPEVELLVRAGIPVMGHIGFTPQSEHVLGGYRVQGRGDGADRLLEDALALEDAGCFAIVMEMVPAPAAKRVTEALRIPTIGIGAGPDCDAQVLVWQDMAGLRGGRAPRFVKKYLDMRDRPRQRGEGVCRRGRLRRVPRRRAQLRGVGPSRARREAGMPGAHPAYPPLVCRASADSVLEVLLALPGAVLGVPLLGVLRGAGEGVAGLVLGVVGAHDVVVAAAVLVGLDLLGRDVVPVRHGVLLSVTSRRSA